MNENIKEDIVRMFKQGLSVAAIADATKAPRPSVLNTLIRAGLYKGGPDTPQTAEGDHDLEHTRLEGQIRDIGPEVREAVLREYRAYLAISTICRRYQVSQIEFWKILVAEAEPLRTHPMISLAQARERRNAEVASLYTMGVAHTEIELLCGIKDTALRKIYATIRNSPDAPYPKSGRDFARHYTPEEIEKVQSLLRVPKIQELLTLKREIEAEHPVLVLPVMVRVKDGSSGV